MRRAVAMTGLLLASGLSAVRAGEAQAPSLTLAPVAGPVSVVQGGGGNIGVVADPAGLVLIDAMEQRVADSLRNAIADVPGSSHIRLVVNTHWHADHTDGNRALGAGTVIVAHEHVRELLSKDQTLLGQTRRALPAEALPTITYSDRLTLFAGGETIRLVHYPRAHTDGDTVVFIDGPKVVHMGDMFFNGMFPFLDVANGGDIDNWGRQLDEILAGLPPDAKLIPGHGPVCGLAELKAFRQMLGDSADVVRAGMKAGKTLEQIQAAGLPPRFEPWTKGFLTTGRWIELVYRSLETAGK
jgi:cyclase